MPGHMVISGKGQRGSVKGKIIPYIIVTNSIFLKKTLFRTIVQGERERLSSTTNTAKKTD